jgi:hypothetical protein
MPATYRSAATALVTALVAAIALSACGNNSNPNPAPTVSVTSSAGGSATSSVSAAAATPPAIVGVTAAGALVVLNPTTGVATKTLVPGHVLGDEVSVSSTGLVYFAAQNGCTQEIEAIPVAGGSVTDIAPGTLPAVSPNGTKLAYADEPTLPNCPVNSSNIVDFYHVDIRTLSSGSTIKLAMLAASQSSGLPYPISHLSWAPDNDHLAVSISAPEDNEGWNLNIVDTSLAQYYLSGTGVTSVPATGSPTPQLSYLREGVYMPNGDLFVSRACCAGDDPVHNTSRLMWEVTTAGTLVHQVAVGYVGLEHTSLDVSSDGGWLLYLAGDSLYVSQGGATPRELTTGLIAAAWA